MESYPTEICDGNAQNSHGSSLSRSSHHPFSFTDRPIRTIQGFEINHQALRGFKDSL